MQHSLRNGHKCVTYHYPFYYNSTFQKKCQRVKNNIPLDTFKAPNETKLRDDYRENHPFFILSKGTTYSSRRISNASTLVQQEIRFYWRNHVLPSVLWRCWLGGRKGIRPIKNLSDEMLAWFCLEQSANDLHMVWLMPMPTNHLCFSKIQNGLSFWYWPTQVVLEKRPLNDCVCVCV